jgi:outer membrane protein assembly factor BamB
MHDGPQASFTTVFAIDPGSGGVRWTRDFGSPNGDICLASPAIALDGSIVFANLRGTVASFHLDGQLAWIFETRDPGPSSPAVDADGTVYVGASQALYAIRAGGALAWSLPLHGGASSSPAIAASGDVYIASSDGMLHDMGP